MFGNRKVKSYKEAKELGLALFPFKDKTIGQPYEITVMPEGYMRGTVMFEDFGRLPEESKVVKKFIVSSQKKRAKKEFS